MRWLFYYPTPGKKEAVLLEKSLLMKAIVNFLFLVLIISFFQSCQKEGPFSELIYEATQYNTRFTFEGTELVSERVDTFEYLVKIAGSQFLVITPDNSNSLCYGAFFENANELQFQSGECACWCNCSPTIDCGGHPILGLYERLNDDDENIELFLDMGMNDFAGFTYKRERALNLKLIE